MYVNFLSTYSDKKSCHTSTTLQTSIARFVSDLVCTCGSNNWETVENRRVHAARGLASIELSFHPCNILRDNRRGISRGNKNVGYGTWKRRFFAIAVRITGKLLKIDGYILRGVWQALNRLFIYATCCVIATGASPGQTKMKAGIFTARCYA